MKQRFCCFDGLWLILLLELLQYFQLVLEYFYFLQGELQILLLLKH